MGSQSKGRIKAMIAKDMQDVYNRGEDVKKCINENLQNLLEYLHSMIAQIPQSAHGPLIPKTPKVLRKKGLQRIDTIPEDDTDVDDTLGIERATETLKIENKQLEETLMGRSRREASIKAATNIRKQQTMPLNTKMRRVSNGSDSPQIIVNERVDNKLKRKKTIRSSSDEEYSQQPSKHSKTENSIRITNIKSEVHSGINLVVDESVVLDTQEKIVAEPRHSKRSRTSNRNKEQSRKESNIADDTVIAPTRDDIEEASMYEDAISKPAPMMNSTMNLNSTLTLKKMMNATVVLEQLSLRKLNETVTIQKKNSAGTKVKDSSDQKPKPNEDAAVSKSVQNPEVPSPMSQPLQHRMQQLKSAIVNNELDDLLTDDESSPEAKKPRRMIKKQDEKKKRRRKREANTSSEDEVPESPPKSLREIKGHKTVKELKNGYKSNALFSPYAKESVKKRVEAFEQAGMHSPKPTADIEIPTRVTRTKTRAIAAAQAEALENTVDKDKTITRNLARKSLAKAKKISLAKHAKDNEDYKENIPMTGQKQIRMISNEKMNQKIQLKTTPLTKSKTQLPVSVNRLQQTPSNNQYPPSYGKALSATSSNIVTNMDSFLQHPRTGTKPNVNKKTEEKKRKLSEDDARKKREDALRVLTEEKKKRRQEKEMKIKLAREAKEKLEMEKREKAEREREEKARLAQQMQEKQREELEKKRILQHQRTQEKEERRKLEEQQRLLRLQEQEEAQRLLAEQKRREMEAERRKEAESRAQQHAAAEASKLRPQILASEAKLAKQMMKQVHANNKYHGPTTYILDSEPDDDASDDENRPKHVIPYWAQSHVRKAQLEMQRYIPMSAVNKFFDAKKSTPDLADFFHGIDRRKLQRTSSAIWKTPPRYSMMEDVNC